MEKVTRWTVDSVPVKKISTTGNVCLGQTDNTPDLKEKIPPWWCESSVL
jgi:hypothetical protein